MESSQCPFCDRFVDTTVYLFNHCWSDHQLHLEKIEPRAICDAIKTIYTLETIGVSNEKIPIDPKKARDMEKDPELIKLQKRMNLLMGDVNDPNTKQELKEKYHKEIKEASDKVLKIMKEKYQVTIPDPHNLPRETEEERKDREASYGIKPLPGFKNPIEYYTPENLKLATVDLERLTKEVSGIKKGHKDYDRLQKELEISKAKQKDLHDGLVEVSKKGGK